MLEPLLVVPILLDVPEAALDAMRATVARELSLASAVSPPRFDPEEGFDPRRGQYRSRTLLQRLLAQAPAPTRVLGVTSLDLFIPVLTYVFGEAELGGRAAVVSTYRLRPERYGLPESPETLLGRLERESVHELGHTLGLLHCASPRCVMHASTYAEEIDLKGVGLCGRCRGSLRP